MFKKGDIYLANLNPRKGNEIGKLRPVLIYQTNILNDINHPTSIIIPLSTYLVDEAYPLRFRVEKRENLNETSDAVCDQIRSIDNNRLKHGKLASLSLYEIKIIDKQIKLILGIE